MKKISIGVRLSDSFKEPFILLLHVSCSYWLAEIQLVGLNPVHVSYRGWRLKYSEAWKRAKCFQED